MKREIIAALLLASLIAGAYLNIRKIDSLTAELEIYADLSEQSARRGDYAEALRLMHEAEAFLDSKAAYTGTFIRHSETDTIYASMTEIYSVLGAQEADKLEACYNDLRRRLKWLSDMDHPSFGKVF